MRIAFVVVVVLHGLLHLLGFAKAFGLATLPQLTQSISRPLGVAWLIAALTMLGVAALFASGLRAWWVAGLVGAGVSQIVLATSWTDARAGTLANALIVVVALLAALGDAPGSLRATYRREVLARSAHLGVQPPVTEVDLARMPPPVARYLRVAGALGRPRTTRFHACFRGAIRSRATTAWMPFVAEQTSFFDPPARLFSMEARMRGVPCDVLHLYRGGRATMEVRLASLVPIVDGAGPLLDRSETVTFLNDACVLAPGALAGPAFRFEPIDDRRTRVHATIGGSDVSAELVFGEDGFLVDFVSDDRARQDDGRTGERLRWSTPLSRPRTFEGRSIASHGEAVWHAPEGTYVYGTFELEALEHDAAVTPRAG